MQSSIHLQAWAVLSGWSLEIELYFGSTVGRCAIRACLEWIMMTEFLGSHHCHRVWSAFKQIPFILHKVWGTLVGIRMKHGLCLQFTIRCRTWISYSTGNLTQTRGWREMEQESWQHGIWTECYLQYALWPETRIYYVAEEAEKYWSK